MQISPYELSCENEPGKRHAVAWLLLAVASVAASSLFALLLVAARAPGLGMLFPGADFYRVALTLHVNLSQVVWFMAFSGVLWSMGLNRRVGLLNHAALGIAVLGAALLAASPLLGALKPLMSNYIPVLDHPVYLTGLLLFGIGIALQALAAFLNFPFGQSGSLGAIRTGLWCAAAAALLSLGLMGTAWIRMPVGFDQHLFFESLFWGGGHVWQICLALLMSVSWLCLASELSSDCRPHPGLVKFLFFVGLIPALLAPIFEISYAPASASLRNAYTQMMIWGSWITALPIGLWLAWRVWRSRPTEVTGQASRTVLLLTFVMFAFGLLLGTAISAETTLVTAHYHGTVGAVTLAFMGLTYALLPRLGFAHSAARLLRLQPWFYGMGLMLMMAGLAWAGSFGAPRKGPGNVQLVGAGYEAVARTVMGIGGTLAVIGILLFLLIVYRALRAGKSTSLSSPVATPQENSRNLNIGNSGLPIKRSIELISLLLIVLMLAYAYNEWSSGSSKMPSPQLVKSHDHLVEKRRQEVDQRFKQGVAMLHAKQYDSAMTAFHRVIQLAPDMPEAYVNAGFALLGKKEYAMAADFFNDATKLNKNQLNAYYGLAVALEGMGNLRAAIEAMYAYLHQAPKDDPFRRKAEAALWEWREALRVQQEAPKNKP